MSFQQRRLIVERFARFIQEIQRAIEIESMIEVEPELPSHAFVPEVVVLMRPHRQLSRLSEAE